MSTVRPDTVRRIAAALAPRGVRAVDAPVSGGARVVPGTLSVFAGGDAEALDGVRDVLGAMATEIFHCGPLGAGQATKLVPGGFAVELAVKDIALAVESAHEVGTPARLAGVARALYAALQSTGGGGLHFPAVVTVLERTAGFEARGETPQPAGAGDLAGHPARAGRPPRSRGEAPERVGPPNPGSNRAGGPTSPDAPDDSRTTADDRVDARPREGYPRPGMATPTPAARRVRWRRPFLGSAAGLALVLAASPGIGGQGPPPRPRLAQPCAGSAPGSATVEVARYDGSRQCEPGDPGSLLRGERQLAEAGIHVLAARKGRDGRIYPAVCGGPTGSMDVYRIPARDLDRARALGFVRFPPPVP